MISNYREDLVEEFMELYSRCKERIIDINKRLRDDKLEYLDSIEQSEMQRKEKIEACYQAKTTLETENIKIKKEAEVLMNSINKAIESLKRKENSYELI